MYPAPSVRPSVNQSIDRSIDLPIDQPTDRPIDLPIDRPTDRSIDRSKHNQNNDINPDGPIVGIWHTTGNIPCKSHSTPTNCRSLARIQPYHVHDMASDSTSYMSRGGNVTGEGVKTLMDSSQ